MAVHVCVHTTAVFNAPESGVTTTQNVIFVVHTSLCMLQHMLNKAKAEPTTDISVIFSSGALDRLAAVLQVCAPPSDILAVQLPSDLHIR